jgi:hypothetical protein
MLVKDNESSAIMGAEKMRKPVTEKRNRISKIN